MDLAHFDIAHYTGHKALDELSFAHRIYILPIAHAARENGLQVQSMDFKTKSDIDGLLYTLSVQDLDIDQIDHINAFHFGGYLESFRKFEAQRCINTAIFFQAMMEATINDALGKKQEGKNFAQKWKGFMSDHSASNEEKGYFEKYRTNIYREVRVPAVHSEKRFGIRNAEAVHFPKVHENIKYGWFCFVFLLKKLHGYSLDYEENGAIMCRGRVPDTVDPDDYCDMGKLSGELLKKHLDHLNKE